nr:hypothetical protein [Gordonia sp. NB41Y]
MSEALGLPSQTPASDATYELLRGIAWASTGGRVPVSTRTLLDRAMPFFASLSGDSADVSEKRERLHHSLDVLAAIGDLALLPRGQWLSVSGCVVRLDAADHPQNLLISGVPLLRMSPEDRDAVHLDGPRRLLHPHLELTRIGIPTITIDEWARRPLLSLAEWTTNEIANELVETPGDLDVASFRFYVPALASAGTRQSNRWFTTNDQLQGRYLAHAEQPAGWTQHYVAEVDSGDVVGIRELDPQDVRPLMFGLDHSAGNPTSVHWVESTQKVLLRLPNPLPYAEARIVAALSDSTGNRQWELTQGRESVRRTLTELGVTFVVSDSTGRKS